MEDGRGPPPATGHRNTDLPRKKAKRRPRRDRPPKPPPPPQPASDDAGQWSEVGGFQSLVEDITCSICLDDLQDPVSIACGHTFCRTCISAHWSTPQPQGYLCPECRSQCSRYQVPTNYRLLNLISKIQRGVQDRSTDQECPASSDHGFPLQLVWTDGDGRLHLDQSVVSGCFRSERLSGYPVYLLCVIGEKRRGKSFLMNYIVRALESQEKGEAFSLGAEGEPLQGFEWRAGVDSTTKGVWIWSRPFILGNTEDKVAVFLLDTEGSLDIEGDRESCIKLSALSMLLSSHLIFNVASCLKETELDYMEMYLSMGEEFTFHNLQYLDILVRDWHDSNCGMDAARFYINREIEKLQKRSSYPKVLWGLKSSYTRCFLLPHPGKGITGESQGRLQDMDEDFQESLKTYITDVVRGVWHRVKLGHSGEILTCSHLPSILQEIVDVLEQQNYGFSTPMEMFYAIKNQKHLESIKIELAQFLSLQPSHLLPSTMRALITDKTKELTAKFSDSLLGSNPVHHTQLLQELESHLKEEEEKFCSSYTTRFTCNAIGLGLTAGVGIYGIMGAAAARGTVVLATQPAVVETFASAEVAAGTVTLLKNGLSALVGRFFRGGL